MGKTNNRLSNATGIKLSISINKHATFNLYVIYVHLTHYEDSK